MGDSAAPAPTASQLNVVSSNSNHDSGIQANLSGIEELNYVICDIQELIKNLDFMVSYTFHLKCSENLLILYLSLAMHHMSGV